MKFTNLLSLATLSTTTAAATTDYFFLYSGSTKHPSLLNNERLRSNTSATYISPGVTPPPHNPADHFNRISVASPADPYTILYVVPTNPHPPPVPGYYGLSDRDGVPDAYRLVYTYRPEDEGAGFLYQEFQLLRTPGRCVPKGKVLLRYKPVGGGTWRWFAVKETTPQGVEKCKWPTYRDGWFSPIVMTTWLTLWNGQGCRGMLRSRRPMKRLWLRGIMTLLRLSWSRLRGR
jgi:hypothetical protein